MVSALELSLLLRDDDLGIATAAIVTVDADDDVDNTLLSRVLLLLLLFDDC